MWLGKRARVKYDELSVWHVNDLVNENLKNPESASNNLRNFEDLQDRKKAWIQKKKSKILPGKLVVWFGRHEGSIFKDLEDDYVMSLINLFNKDGHNAKPSI